MALGMKRWLGVVVVACALVALRTLPPSALELPTRRDVPLQAERRLDALRSEIVEANTRLQQLRWAEAVIPATLGGEGPVVLRFPEGAAPEPVERMRARVLAELAVDTPSDVALGVFFEDPRDVQYPDAPSIGHADTHYYFGRRDGRPYCAAVHPLSLWRTDAEGRILLSMVARDRSLLGVCALLRAYGVPGPAVRAWLADGGTALAAAATPGGGIVQSYRTMPDAAFARRGVLGLRGGTVGYLLNRVDYDRCFAGVTAGCAALFLHPELDNSSWSPAPLSERKARSLGPVSAIQANSLFEPADYHVAADLAEEFGRDRFLEWWTADGDVAEAFHASFGVEAGVWYLRRVGAFVTIVEPGPGVSGSGLLGGALLLALSTVIAGLWSRRRRVA